MTYIIATLRHGQGCTQHLPWRGLLVLAMAPEWHGFCKSSKVGLIWKETQHAVLVTK